MSAYVALMRGINVGGKNRIGMKDLANVFADAGCKDVQTFIQSGNVIVDAPARILRSLETRIPQEIESRFGFRSPVVLRSREALQEVIRRNPFVTAKVPAESLHVMFLSGEPEASGIAKLDPDRSPPDSFVVSGLEIYLCMPNGMGRTKLTNAYFDAKLGVVSTVRNWQTVQKLLELMSGGRS